MDSKTQSEEKGFTIIEIVVSIFILTVALVGIFTALSIVVIATSDSVDRLTATYLAQEGMEIVRNIRDTNWLKIKNEPGGGHSWIDNLGVNGANVCASGCEADYTDVSLHPTTGNYLNLMDGFYVYETTNPSETKFQRKIKIAPVPDKDDISSYIIKVVVEVSWNKKATLIEPAITAGAGSCPGANCVKVEETLYNWYK